MTLFVNLTPQQRRLLASVKHQPVFVPYGDGDASALLLGGLANRVTAFGKLAITPAGRAALAAHQTTTPEDGNGE